MKRTRDDVCAGSGSQFKRTFCTSRGDSYGQSQVPGGGGGGGGGGDGAGNCGGGGGSTLQKLTTTDALSYLKDVKDMFQNQREKYDMFLEVMKDFKAQRTDTAGVIARVKELFKGHNNLIFGFNTFLPKGYEIKLDEDEAPPKKTVEFDEAISFVNKIKKRFQNDEHVYKSFLDILNMYRKESKDINEVYKEVAALFEDHPDLLEEFTRFLPNNSVMPAQYVVSNGRNSCQRFNERSSTVASMRQMQPDKQRRRDKLITAHNCDLSVDHPELDDDKAMIKVPKEQRKCVEKENRDRRIHNQDEREPDLDNIRDLSLQQFPDKKIYVKNAEGFGLTADFPSHDDKDTLKGMYNQAFSFCEKVKERLGSSDDYQAFLKCLHIFSNGIIKRHDLHDLVISLLGKHPDLMDKFNDFLDRCENIDGFLAGVISKKSLCSDGQLPKSSKLEDKDEDQKREMDGTKEMERYQEKYMGKSIQELDLSNCERCTPSYRHLPDDYPIPMASQRSELGAQVLNDYWVSVTSGSEDYSFKHMRRNQYEESLFRCEDDRFELDMLLESVSSAAKRTEELYNSIIENKIHLEGPIRLEEHFSVLNLRCIERLYGDHGLDAIETLRKNPTVALPVILTRLKQKQEEWSRCHSDFNKVWAEIYAKNHYRSLDHRSFYFKQQDSKNLNPKSLVTEIKEIKEKQQKQDDVLQAIAAGNKQPLIPHLEFEYSDIGIHEDLYKLVQYSCEEVFASKELLNKILRLWTTFLEPMLGVPSRSHEAVDVVPVGESLLMNSRQPKSDNYEADGRITEVKIVHEPCLAANDKENGSIDTDQVFRDDPLMDKGQKNLDGSDKISGFSKQFVSDEERADYNASSIAIRGENSLSRTSFEQMISGCVHSSARPTGTVSDDDSVGKSQSGDASLVERRDIATLVPLANGMVIGSSNQKGFAGPCKIEKEEGELSPTPNADSQEDNCVGYGDANMLAKPQSKLDLERSKFRSRNGEGERCLEAGLRNGADADDEDIENASEAGVDVSQSESAGDECSQEENEGEEDIEHDDIDDKAESEGEAGRMCNGQSAGGDGSLLPLSERSLLPVKPLTKHVSADSFVEERKDSRVFYGNDDFYVLFRLHQILYERILSAKTNSMSAEAMWRIAKDANSLDPYSRFMNALYNLLDGSADNAKFEDECRAIIGNQSYMLFTLDKLIYKLVRQLQAVATDEIDNKLLQLFEYEKSRKPGRLTNSVYHSNARVILHEENIYHFDCSSNPSKLSIQLMDNMTEKPEVFAVSIDPNFAVYLYNDYLSVFSDKKEPHGFILQRNKRKYSDLDDLSAMEGIKVINGLECKIACNSSKISYVLDTEDLFFRPRKNRKTSLGTASSKHYRAKVERFHRILPDSK